MGKLYSCLILSYTRWIEIGQRVIKSRYFSNKESHPTFRPHKNLYVLPEIGTTWQEGDRLLSDINDGEYCATTQVDNLLSPKKVRR